MAVDAFLKIDGITGDAKQGLVQLESFSWGLSNSGVPTCNATGGGGAGKVSFQDFSFTSQLGSQSPKLFVAAAMGSLIANAQLTLTENGEQIAVTFFNVFVSNYKEDQGVSSGLSGGARESVSFNFAKIEVQAGSVSETFDLCTGKVG